MLSIPIGRRESLLNTRMSYLKFKLNNTTVGTAPLTPDFNITSIFRRPECCHDVSLV